LAAIVYSSWPLGYWLNPAVNRNSLASGLEAIGQPYNWLFIVGDVLSGLLILAVGWQLWLHYLSGHRHRYLAGVVLAAVGFGVGTIVDALLPERCVPNLQVCPNFTQDHLLLVHGVFSILAALALFVSLAWLWWRERSNYLLNLLMVGYILFGIISLLEAVRPGNTGNWSQHYYITLSSIWLAVLPPVVRRSLKRL
jgi:hypothetical protein